MACLKNDHPLEKFINAGLKFSICTDDLLIFDKTVSEEIYLLASYHPEHLNKKTILQAQIDAINSSFLKDEVLKSSIRTEIESYAD
jgi:adenosine deaminase